MKLTKRGIILRIFEDTNITQKTIKDIIENLFTKIADALAKGDDVEFRGFGIFKIKKRGKRIGRNPKTGEIVSIPERKVVVFKPGRFLNKRIEDGRDL